MTKALRTLIIASAGLWLALPAAAQFEINPDHFDDVATTTVQPRPEQFKGGMKLFVPYKQGQRLRVEAVKATKSPANTLPTLSSVSAVQQRRASGANRVAQRPADRKADKQSRLAMTHRPKELGPQ